MKHHILVTGGAGFIGSFLVDKLIEEGHDIRILDNLEPQVHNNETPNYLNGKAEFIKGDVLDISQLQESIKDIDVIFHEAAMVGVGQSMYQVKRYVEANTVGTANLLDILVNKNHNIKKLVVASSMSTYGEGSYKCEDCGEVSPLLRSEEQMKKQDWELHCPECDKMLKPIPTKETKRQDVNSIYAITKKDQEEMVLNIGKSYGIPSVALRYFNVFGPRQSLSNPYTGVVAIFNSMIKNNNPPIIFEDGQQSRDFISVHDIVNANILSMNKSSANYEVFNVGAGRQITIKEIAEKLAKLQNKDIKPQIIGKFRKGDVRHCFSDISKIRSKLDFEPKIEFEAAMQELMKWSDSIKAIDKVEKATAELKEKGLVS
ncbi:MAG: SDR family NAD(P)-dependent oxidoreductase [Nanoarchaeota archaeon]|nr:SDR family NAD(P)-dependent oxidoreductase [Nanoarchaeota archaeon]